MKLTTKLLGYLNKVFNTKPDSFLAIRVTYDGQMTWTVADRLLSFKIAGGTGSDFEVDLSQYTLFELADLMAAKTGYSVPYYDVDQGSLGATVLIDSSGDIDTSNGDHLLGYSSLLWVLIDTAAKELKDAKDQIIEMLKQMVIKTSEGEWADEWGSYPRIPRLSAETDLDYTTRIIVEFLRIRSNNLALEQLIEDQTGVSVSIKDLPWKGNNILLSNTLNHNLNSMVYVVGPKFTGGYVALFTTLGITVFKAGIFPTGGYPYWGLQANDNPLVCAFAVIFNVTNLNTLSLATRQTIARIIDRSKQSGTIPLYFISVGLLDTNVSGDLLNDQNHVAGPLAGQYIQVSLS